MELWTQKVMIFHLFGPFFSQNEVQEIPAYKNLLFRNQAEIGSYFKGTKTNFKVQRFLFEGGLV